MTAKPIVPRAQARRDLEDAIAYYASEAGITVALGLIDAVESAYRAIAARPAAGSPRHGQDLSLPGLRSLALKKYPYLVFYIEREDHMDLWRMLHARRDIPASLQAPET